MARVNCFILALMLARAAATQGQVLPVTSSFEAIPNSGWTPCDPTIAAGPSSLVTTVNSKIVIFNKQGAKLFEQQLSGSKGFWKVQGASSSVAEPWTIFDPHSSRFIVVAADFGSKKGDLYLAISTSATPASSSDWHKYGLPRSGTHQAAGFAGVATYPDYVKAGVNSDRIYITSIHFAKDQTITGLFSHAEVFAIEKSSILAGGTPVIAFDAPVITGAPVFSIQPAIVFDSGPTMYLTQSVMRQPSAEIVLHAIEGQNWSSWSIPVAAFERPSDVPQAGSASLLQNIDARLMSAVVRNGSLWTAHAVRDPAAGPESLVRWYELDVTDVGGTGPGLVQSGDVNGGSGVHTWLPHISADGSGNMALGFSVGGSGQYAAIGYTGRQAGDPLGTTAPIQIARAGQGAYTAGGWGEYSGLAADPDGSSFWLFHEYPTSQGNWNTFAASFQVEPIVLNGPLHCGDLDGSSSRSGKNWKATVVVTAHDGDHNPLPGATVTIQWSTGATASGQSDASGNCAFTLNSISSSTPSVTLTVTGAAHAALAYDSGANHDPDGDSNGTSITLSKP